MTSKMVTCWDVDPLIFDIPEDVQNYFLEGQCPALAWELHKLTNWTIAMLSSNPVGSPDYLGHIFVIDSEGMAIDIKGRRALEVVKDDWYFAGHLYRFWNIKEFEYEMQGWYMTTRFDRDKKAKMWASHIVNLLK